MSIILAFADYLRHEEPHDLHQLSFLGRELLNNLLEAMQFLHRAISEGRRAILVTLVAVQGASTRDPGSYMAVAENGDSVGSFSGGCIERAVVAEALAVLATGGSRLVRYGAGSPYVDIRLPCGGAMDLLFTPLSDRKFVDDALLLLQQRSPLAIDIVGETIAVSPIAGFDHGPQVSARDNGYRLTHLPPPRFIILGQGPPVKQLAALVAALGLDCQILTPDRQLTEMAAGSTCTINLLTSPAASDLLQPDPWSACIFFFHDHDWEAHLLQQALDSPAYYVGAMGSEKAHIERRRRLAEIGVDDQQIKRIDAPIGLIQSSRDPATLALSTLAQVVDRYHQCFSRNSKSSG